MSAPDEPSDSMPERSPRPHVPVALKSVGDIVNQTYEEWRADGAPQLAAALTYYTFLSLAPVLVLLVGVAGRYLGRATITETVVERAGALAGPAGEAIVREVARSAGQGSLGTLASVVALAIALLGSMRVFGQLRIAFDRMWNIPRAQPPGGSFMNDLRWGLSALGRDNLAAFLMVIGAGLLLIASVVLSSALSLAADRVAPLLEVGASFLRLAEGALSLALVTALFALIYRVLPRTTIGWKDVWVGALITGGLFTLGRMLLGVYFSHASPGSAYGAAGSVVAFLVWVNLSLQLVLFGAEFTHVWTYTHGSRADQVRA